MIEYKVGDMVESYRLGELDAYAHQCNCFCTMGAGIARYLSKVNPDILAVDKSTKRGDRDKLGNYTVAKTKGFPLLYNIYGQYHWNKYKVADGRNTDYQALKEGLLAVRETLHYEQWVDTEAGHHCKQKTLGIPLIGCGLAGGNWHRVVKPMVAEVFENSGVDVTVFVLEKDLDLVRGE